MNASQRSLNAFRAMEKERDEWKAKAERLGAENNLLLKSWLDEGYRIFTGLEDTLEMKNYLKYEGVKEMAAILANHPGLTDEFRIIVCLVAGGFKYP